MYAMASPNGIIWFFQCKNDNNMMLLCSGDCHNVSINKNLWTTTTSVKNGKKGEKHVKSIFQLGKVVWGTHSLVTIYNNYLFLSAFQLSSSKVFLFIFRFVPINIFFPLSITPSTLSPLCLFLFLVLPFFLTLTLSCFTSQCLQIRKDTYSILNVFQSTK